MDFLQVKTNDTLQAIAQDLGAADGNLYDEIQLYVLAFNANEQLLLSKQNLPQKPSLGSTPNIHLIVGEHHTTGRTLDDVAQDLLSSEQRNIKIHSTVVCFAGPSPTETSTLNIVTGARIRSVSLITGTWLTEREFCRLDFTNRELGVLGSKKLLRALSGWKRHLSGNRALAIRPPPSGRNPKLQELGHAPWLNEKFSVPARMIGGRRHGQAKHIQRSKKKVRSTAGSKVLESAFQAWNGLKRLGRE